MAFASHWASTLMQHLINKPPHLALKAMLAAVGQQLTLDVAVLGYLKSDQTVDSGLVWRIDQSKAIAASSSDLQTLNQWLAHPTLQATLLSSTPTPIPLDRLVSTSPADRPFQLPPELYTVLVKRTQYRGRTNGILFLLRRQSLPWTDTDMQMLQTLSNQAAIAVSQINLEQQAEQQFQQQSLVYQLVGAIREGWELERIHELATEGLVKLLHLSCGFVLSFKYADPQLKGRMGHSIPRTRATVESLHYASDEAAALHQTNLPPGIQHWLGYSFQINDCQIGQHLLSRVDHSVTIPAVGLAGSDDTVATGLTPDAIAPIFSLAQMPSLVVMPLENQGISLGCLVLQHSHLRLWQPDELALVRLVASHISTAMIQANTLRKVQDLVDERTSQLRHSLDVQAKLYEKTRQQVEQLQRMNRVMEEFLSTVSHELLTPLTSMKMAIRMLREAPLSEGQRDRYLTILDNQCSQETRLIQDLLTIQKIETHTVSTQLHQVDLHYLVRDLQQAWQESLDNQHLSLATALPDRALQIRTDPESLHRILTELLTNARKYSHPGTTIDLQITVLSDQAVPHVAVRLENTGVGILPEEIPLIFEKFRRGQEALRNTIPGLGLGLALARGLAAHLSGGLDVTSTPIADGEVWHTCFVLTLPLSPELL